MVALCTESTYLMIGANLYLVTIQGEYLQASCYAVHAALSGHEHATHE